jgi:ABC-type transporter MlaC component
MMRIVLFCLLMLGALSSCAQSVAAFSVPQNAASQLEDVKETTKAVADPQVQSSKVHAEVRPEINRLLVIAADNFLRVTKEAKPTKAAYLQCLDRDLARIYPLTTNVRDRQQVAEFFQELMEIVGLPSSEGRLTAFAASPASK